MSQYPNYIRPSRSSKKQVIDIWDKLSKEVKILKKHLKYGHFMMIILLQNQQIE